MQVEKRFTGDNIIMTEEWGFITGVANFPFPTSAADIISSGSMYPSLDRMIDSMEEGKSEYISRIVDIHIYDVKVIDENGVESLIELPFIELIGNNGVIELVFSQKYSYYFLYFFNYIYSKVNNDCNKVKEQILFSTDASSLATLFIRKSEGNLEVRFVA